MPNTGEHRTMYFGQNDDPDSFATSDAFQVEGQLGLVHHWRDRRYQRVKLDSGATSAVPTGAPAAAMLLYWKDKDAYLVTHDQRFGLGGPSAARNQVAGILRNPAAAGDFIDALQEGDNIDVRDGGNTFAAGETVIAEADPGDTTGAAADRVAIGNAPTHLPLGYARGAASGGVVAVDVNIPSIP